MFKVICGWDLGRNILVFLLVVILLLRFTIAKQYRTDYIYNRKTDAFYKFHIESYWPFQAKNVCNIEGGELMVPTSDEDIMVVHEMFKKYPDIKNFAWVASDGNHHESAEVTPIINLNQDVTTLKYSIPSVECDVVTRDGGIQSYDCGMALPFICKVEARYAYYDSQCKVFGKGYRYYDIGSCYKIPRISFSWNQAYHECNAEGAHLVILNSEIEHQVVWNLTNTEPPVQSAYTAYFFFAGIRAQEKKDGSPILFKTIFNQTLEETGYSQWTVNEPNNALGNEYCGTIFKNDGKYNDVDCSRQFGFICEKELRE